eukprot:10208352-Ditylum_brightwellii.AAC.1
MKVIKSPKPKTPLLIPGLGQLKVEANAVCSMTGAGGWGWVKLDADGTMKEGCKTLLRNSTAGNETVSGGHTKC